MERVTGLALAALLGGCASSAPTVNRAGGGTAPEAPVAGGLLAAQGGSLGGAGLDVAAIDRAEASARCKALDGRAIGFDEEARLGLAVSDRAAAKLPNRGLYLDPPGAPETERTELTRYLALLGRGLAGYSSRPALPWTFLVLDADEVRSFSAPGGYVWVTTGLLRAVEDEAQLAGVLAHEISHVALAHGLVAWRKQEVAVCTAEAAGRAMTASLGAQPSSDLFAGWPDHVGEELIRKLSEGVASEVIDAGFGQQWELDADASAVGLLLFAGYDVAQYTAFLDKLPAAQGRSPYPPAASRAARIEDTRKKEYAGFDFAALKRPRLPACVTSLRR